MPKPNPIPEGYHSITPYLAVDNTAKAIEFYSQAFGATERFRMEDPATGKIGHAEVQIGDSVVMLADEYPDIEFEGPKKYGGTTVHIMLYTDDVDTLFQRAIDAGATVIRPLENQFYGDRSGQLKDPFGHCWHLSMHVEDLSMEDVQERMAKTTGET